MSIWENVFVGICMMLYAEREEVQVREGNQEAWCPAPFVAGHPLIVLKDAWQLWPRVGRC